MSTNDDSISTRGAVVIIAFLIFCGWGFVSCNSDLKLSAKEERERQQTMIEKGYFEQEYCSHYSKKWVLTTNKENNNATHQ